MNILRIRQILRKYYRYKKLTDHRYIQNIEQHVLACLKPYDPVLCQDCPYMLHCHKAIKYQLREDGKTKSIGYPSNVY